MFSLDTLIHLAVNSIAFGSWNSLRGVFLGVTTNPWYFWFVSVVSTLDTDLVNTYMEPVDPIDRWEYEEFLDVPLAIPTALSLQEEEDWGGIRFMNQIKLRRVIIHVCRETPSWNVRVRHKELEIGQDILDRQMYWVADSDYLTDKIPNVVEKRNVIELMELERVTWEEYTFPAIRKWEIVHEWNHYYRFDTCIWGDAELYMEETRSQQGMHLHEYVWNFSAQGRYFIP